ncbi:MAG: type IX secretion system membrane protein PorP/SprF [Flavobacteriales bacterium]
MKRIIFLLTILAVSTCTVHAQQISRQTQFFLNPYAYNPGYAGILSETPLLMSYRNQWAGFKGAPVTMYASGHMTGPNNTGFGAIFQRDHSGGAISKTSLELTGAYHIALNTYGDAVSFGMSLVGGQYRFDNSSLNVYDPNDIALNGLQAESKFNVDASAGMVIYGKRYYFGMSIPQLIQSKLRIQGLQTDQNKNVRHFQFMGMFRQPISDNFSVQGSGFMRFSGFTPAQIEANATLKYRNEILLGWFNEIWAGMSVRPGDAIAFNFGGLYNSYTLGYSFDITTSAAKVMSPFSHELVVGYVIPSKYGNTPNGVLGPRRLDRKRIIRPK